MLREIRFRLACVDRRLGRSLCIFRFAFRALTFERVVLAGNFRKLLFRPFVGRIRSAFFLGKIAALFGLLLFGSLFFGYWLFGQLFFDDIAAFFGQLFFDDIAALFGQLLFGNIAAFFGMLLFGKLTTFFGQLFFRCLSPGYWLFDRFRGLRPRSRRIRSRDVSFRRSRLRLPCGGPCGANSPGRRIRPRAGGPSAPR